MSMSWPGEEELEKFVQRKPRKQGPRSESDYIQLGTSQVGSVVKNPPANARALDAQLCLTLCDSMDCSPLSSSVHGLLQARILEWPVQETQVQSLG